MTAVAWRKSSHSYANGSCVEVEDWRKSSRSAFIEAGTGDAAVVVRDSTVEVRDSTDRDGPGLTFTPDAWRAFTAALKAERAAPH